MHKLLLTLIVLAGFAPVDAFAQYGGGRGSAGAQLAVHSGIQNSGSNFLGRQLNHAVTMPRQDAKPKIERDAKK